MTLEVSYLFGGNVGRNGFFERPFGKRGGFMGCNLYSRRINVVWIAVDVGY